MLEGHYKKVQLLRWHPTAGYTMATASLDQTIKIWDIEREKSTLELDIGAHCYTMNWNNNGS